MHIQNSDITPAISQNFI